LGLAAAAALVAIGAGPAPTRNAPPGQAQATANDLFAANLGIFYQLVPYKGAFAARLTRYPVAGSPASQLQLEPGDMIVSLDGRAIHDASDVHSHVSRTDFVFVNVRTGLPQSGAVFIPQAGGGGETLPPVGGYDLGIETKPTVVYPTPYRQIPSKPFVVGPGSKPPRRALRVTAVGVGSPGARFGLRPGDVILDANGVATETSASLRNTTAASNGLVRLVVAKGGFYKGVRSVVVDVRPPLVPGPAIPGAPNPAAGPPAPGGAPPPPPTPALR
jgi:S1-C subfamily serine protease